MVWLLPEFTVYVTVAFGVPVNVIKAVPPLQIVVAPAIVAVGAGTIAMIVVPEIVWLQLADATLTKVYVLFRVKAGVVIVAVPEAFNVIVWLDPESTI